MACIIHTYLHTHTHTRTHIDCVKDGEEMKILRLNLFFALNWIQVVYCMVFEDMFFFCSLMHMVSLNGYGGTCEAYHALDT